MKLVMLVEIVLCKMEMSICCDELNNWRRRRCSCVD